MNDLKRREIVDALRDLWLDDNLTGLTVRSTIKRDGAVLALPVRLISPSNEDLFASV